MSYEPCQDCGTCPEVMRHTGGVVTLIHHCGSPHGPHPVAYRFDGERFAVLWWANTYAAKLAPAPPVEGSDGMQLISPETRFSGPLAGETGSGRVGQPAPPVNGLPDAALAALARRDAQADPWALFRKRRSPDGEEFEAGRPWKG